MTKQELELAAILLELASERFSTHGCNDFDLPSHWTQQQCDDFMLAIHTWNGDPEEHEPGRRITDDWFAMDYLAEKLKQEASDDLL